MAPPSSEEFVARFRSLSPDERTAFVADLLSARGWQTDRDGRCVVASAGGHTRRVAVGTRRQGVAPGVDGDADAVVRVPSRTDRLASLLGRDADGRDQAATVVDPADLHEQLLHAIGREQATRLYREHFDAEFDRDRGASSATPPSRVAALATAGVLLALVVLAAVAGTALDGTDRSPLSTSTPTPAVSEGSNVPAPSGALVERTATAVSRPGVSASNIRNVSRLRQLHGRMLAPGPVAMRTTFRGPRFVTGFDTRASGYDEDDEVALDVCAVSDRRYSIGWRTNFGVSDTSTSNTSYARFADGSSEYRRIVRDGEVSYRLTRLPDVRNGSETIRSVTDIVLFRYLNTTQRRVDTIRNDIEPRYRLVATGEPARLDHAVQDYRAIAIVRPDGFVTDIRVSYVHPGTQAPVQITAEYEPQCEIDDPPEWYDEARTTTRREP
jgi:hypothetical protein